MLERKLLVIAVAQLLLLLHMCFCIAGFIFPGLLFSISSLSNLLMMFLVLICLPAFTSKPAFHPLERELLSLPTRLSGLGIVVPCTNFSSLFSTSQNISSPLVEQLLK